MLRVTYDPLTSGDTEDAHAAHEGARVPSLVVSYPQLNILKLTGWLLSFALDLLVYLVDLSDTAGTYRVAE